MRTHFLKTLALLAVVVCGAFALSACGSSAPTKTDAANTVDDSGDFVLSYETPDAGDEATAALVKDSGYVEEAVDGLNEQYGLPDDIGIVFTTDDPDEAGPYFDGEENTLSIPYSYLTGDRDIFANVGYNTDEEIDDAVLSDLLFTLYHEVGHALIQNLDLPITGREEDSVDSLAAVILNETYEDGQSVVLSAADWFASLSASNSEDGYDFADFADEHSLDDQRYVTLLCLVYGSDPDNQQDLVDPEYLPEERAAGCEDEYAQARDSWNTLLKPYALT